MGIALALEIPAKSASSIVVEYINYYYGTPYSKQEGACGNSMCALHIGCLKLHVLSATSKFAASRAKRNITSLGGRCSHTQTRQSFLLS